MKLPRPGAAQPRLKRNEAAPLVDRVDLHRLRDPEQWRAVTWIAATRSHTYHEGTLAECLAWIAAEVAS